MKKMIIPAMLAALTLLAACGAKETAASGGDTAAASAGTAQKIEAAEAYGRMQSGDTLVILDVRTAEEYAQAHIEGAVLLPNEDIGETRPEMLPVLDEEILVYCRSGNRSAQAAEKLADMGYTNVFDFGGINDWTYGTVTGAWEPETKDATLASFAAYDLYGAPVDESIFSGHKLTMINVWATYCSPCLSEMPELGELAGEYADKGVQIVGIVSDIGADGAAFSQRNVEKARSLVDKTGAAYTHILPSADLVSALLQYVSAVPTTVFVDENGNIVGDGYMGARDKEQWAQIIDETLVKVGDAQ